MQILEVAHIDILYGDVLHVQFVEVFATGVKVDGGELGVPIHGEVCYTGRNLNGGQTGHGVDVERRQIGTIGEVERGNVRIFTYLESFQFGELGEVEIGRRHIGVVQTSDEQRFQTVVEILDALEVCYAGETQEVVVDGTDFLIVEDAVVTPLFIVVVDGLHRPKHVLVGEVLGVDSHASLCAAY